MREERLRSKVLDKKNRIYLVNPLIVKKVMELTFLKFLARHNSQLSKSPRGLRLWTIPIMAPRTLKEKALHKGKALLT